MTTSVVYPPRASQALGFLHSALNDIEVFVEDSAAPNLWVKLLRKLLPNNTRLNNVNILGGRDNVLAACRADQADDGRKKIYIIDADLDLLRGKPKPRLKFLYRLRAYSVENYLIGDEQLTSLATSFDSHITDEDARQKLDYSGWIAHNAQILNSLFICYAVTHTLANSQQTVGYSVFKLLDDNTDRNDLCKSKTSRRIFQLYRKVIEEQSSDTAREVYLHVRSQAAKLDVARSVSAKDYVLPQVFSLMKTYFRVNVSLKQFKVMLAAIADRNVDPYLARRLARICS